MTYMENTRRWKCYGKHPRPQFSLKVGALQEKLHFRCANGLWFSRRTSCKCQPAQPQEKTQWWATSPNTTWAGRNCPKRQRPPAPTRKRRITEIAAACKAKFRQSQIDKPPPAAGKTANSQIYPHGQIGVVGAAFASQIAEVVPFLTKSLPAERRRLHGSKCFVPVIESVTEPFTRRQVHLRGALNKLAVRGLHVEEDDETSTSDDRTDFHERARHKNRTDPAITSRAGPSFKVGVLFLPASKVTFRGAWWRLQKIRLAGKRSSKTGNRAPFCSSQAVTCRTPCGSTRCAGKRTHRF